ncbi:MAG TPA: outer membrane beta-barrel protein [Steroidobacteraceae bacterium]|nr:outer membrane beta-barrel protein [Steroidobacteraceae bacterium]
MLQRFLTGVVTGVLMASAVQAAEPQVEITPFLTQRGGGGFYDTAGNDVNLLSKSGTAVAFNWAASEHGSQYELLYSRQSTHIDTTTPAAMRVEYLQLGGTTLIGNEDAHVVPYASGGIGAARFSPDSGSSLTEETRWAFSLGAGIRIPIVNHVRLRFEARGYLTWLDGSSSLFCNKGATAPCPIQARGQTLFQYEALGGISFGF